MGLINILIMNKIDLCIKTTFSFDKKNKWLRLMAKEELASTF
jgi:hypothetical protein